MRAFRCFVLVSIVALTNGCYSAERGDQARGIGDARTVARTSYGDLDLDRILRVDAADRELDESLASGPTLELVRSAVTRRNPDAEVALERWVAYLERVPQRLAPGYPVLGYHRYSSMFKMHEIGVLFGIPFPTKLLTDARAALAESRASRADYAERLNLLRSEAATACATLYLAQRELEILDRNLAILSRLVEVVKAQLTAGRAAASDVLKLEVDRDALQAQRETQIGNVRVAESVLNVLLDRAPSAAMGRVPGLPTPRPSGEFALLVDQAIVARPELDAVTARARAADEMVWRAQQEWIPDLQLGAAYVRDFGSANNFVDLTAGISLPIFVSAIQARVREAEAEARRSRAEVRVARNRVLGEVRRTAVQVDASAGRFEVLARGVKHAGEAYRAAEAAYTTGQTSFLALLDAQRALLARELEREAALSEHTIRRAELDRAVGLRSESDAR